MKKHVYIAKGSNMRRSGIARSQLTNYKSEALYLVQLFARNGELTKMHVTVPASFCRTTLVCGSQVHTLESEWKRRLK